MTGGSEGNARLTAATAVVLLVLLAAEGLTLLAIQQLLLPHVFLGFLLIPPVLLKLSTTGWRMLSYYRGRAEYMRRGPPALFLRMLVAPLIVVSTISLFATGVAVVAVGHGGLLLGLHKASFIVWVAATTMHVLAHVLKLPRQLAGDWWHPDALAGGSLRRFALTGTLVAGLTVGIVAIPLADHWQDSATAVVGIDAD